ncbi:MAG TPA: histidine kinase [Kofleriaceae bacterium]|nr:histidine kinase [Kofleriaceae bacterium]
MGLGQAYRRAKWRWIAGAWLAIFGFDVARRTIDAYRDGRTPAPAWLLVSFASLALWAVSTPFMLWLGARAPLDRAHRVRNAALHAAGLVGLIMADAALQLALWPARASWTFTSMCFALTMLDGFSYATVIAISHVQRANQRYRDRVRAQAALDQALTTARLRALEMQLQPHFRFNALHAVGALVREARPDDAVRSLAALSGLLRATLADGGHEIALGDEIALAHRYLALQKIRFADRLRVHVDIAPEVERARVPRLILQPLLENAIRHGVERSRTAVFVEIRARARGARLELVVRDHGGVRDAAPGGLGIGLANTRARLAALYGAAHTLELSPTDGGGLALRLESPLLVAPPAAAHHRELELDGELREDLAVPA